MTLNLVQLKKKYCCLLVNRKKLKPLLKKMALLIYFGIIGQRAALYSIRCWMFIGFVVLKSTATTPFSSTNIFFINRRVRLLSFSKKMISQKLKAKIWKMVKKD